MWTPADNIIVIGLIGILICAIAVHYREAKKGWVYLTAISMLISTIGIIIKAFGG